jgi:hypothetical protein
MFHRSLFVFRDKSAEAAFPFCGNHDASCALCSLSNIFGAAIQDGTKVPRVACGSLAGAYCAHAHIFFFGFRVTAFGSVGSSSRIGKF